MTEVKSGAAFMDASKLIDKQKEILREMKSLYNYAKTSGSQDERTMIATQISALDHILFKTATDAMKEIAKVTLFKPLEEKSAAPAHIETKKVIPQKGALQYHPLSPQEIKAIEAPDKKEVIKPDDLERLTISRLKKKQKKAKEEKEKKPSSYIKFASQFFYNHAIKVISKGKYKNFEKDLVKANMEMVPAAYVSVLYFSTIISVGAAFLIMLFFLFFNLSSLPPFISMVPASDWTARFMKVVWLLVFIPIATYIFIYFYPTLERRSISSKILQELPFAVIHMSAISGSMIEPSKIFRIISSTKEYPYLEKEFTKLQNEINIYGYDLVTALKSQAKDSPSRKLSELFNGLSTTITSGGDLPVFFEKRAQTLLFEHKLEIEKESKSDETFMDIYISVVVAAPMILMLLLMMMRISGIGISLSTGTITLIMIIGVIAVNIFFLTFLHMKRPQGD